MTRVSGCHTTMRWARSCRGFLDSLGCLWSWVRQVAEGVLGQPGLVPTPSPACAPRRTLITQGSEGGLHPFPGKGSTYYLRIEAQFAGLLEAIVNWTLQSNRMDIAWGRGDFVPSPNCPILAANVGPEKPKSVSLTIAEPGTYTLVLQSQRASNESISYQIFLTH